MSSVATIKGAEWHRLADASKEVEVITQCTTVGSDGSSSPVSLEFMPLVSEEISFSVLVLARVKGRMSAYEPYRQFETSVRGQAGQQEQTPTTAQQLVSREEALRILVKWFDEERDVVPGRFHAISEKSSDGPIYLGVQKKLFDGDFLQRLEEVRSRVRPHHLELEDVPVTELGWGLGR